MRKKKHPEHVNHERWLVSYADFITLLFAFFVVMFAVSRVDSKKMNSFSESFSRAVGESFMLEGGTSILREGGPPPPEPPGNGEGRLPKELERLAKALADKREDLSGLKVLRRRNELVIRLSDSVLFDSGEDTVKEPAVRVLATIANELRERKVDIRVEGHTDDVPIRTVRFHSNWDLSAARATAVIAQLAGPGRIAPGRLAASGYGEFHPVASNLTPDGRAQNRRVDLVIAAAVEETKDTAYSEAPGEEGARAAGSGAPDAEEAPAERGAMGPPPPPEMGGEGGGHEEARTGHEGGSAGHGEATATASPHGEATATTTATASQREATTTATAASPHGTATATASQREATATTATTATTAASQRGAATATASPNKEAPAAPRRPGPPAKGSGKAPAKPEAKPVEPAPEVPMDFPLRH